MNFIREWAGEIALVAILLVIILSMGGCATTPKTIGECEDIFFSMEEVRACEVRVLRYEDRLHQRKLTQEERERCLWPDWWDGRRERCYSQFARAIL